MGKKKWVRDQTSIIAKNGGTIEAENFTDIGAIIGSESADNKLTVIADTVTVENLGDKDKSTVHGGGMSVSGPSVPNISIVDGLQDKRQDTNATAINTDFVVSGEKKTSEELGFNTDIDKAQVITRDEEHYLNVDLHTDLLNKSERDKLKEAGQKIEDFAKAITDTNNGGVANTYKENRFGRLLKKDIETNPHYGMLDEVSPEEKVKLLNQLVNDFLHGLGYSGPPVTILGAELGNGTLATAAAGSNLIFLNTGLLDSNDTSAILTIVSHELGHFNSYDNDSDDPEETANNIGSKVGGVEVSNSLSDKEKADYLNAVNEKYKNLPDVETATEIVNLIAKAEIDAGSNVGNIDSNGSAMVMNPPSKGAEILVDPPLSEEEKRLTGQLPPFPAKPVDRPITTAPQHPEEPIDIPNTTEDPNPPDEGLTKGQILPFPLDPPKAGSNIYYSKEEDDKAFEDFYNSTRPGEKKSAKVDQREKEGDFETAKEDFDKLNPTDIQVRSNGTITGVLPDGRNINVRGHSTDGRITVEIQNEDEDGTKIKVRYNPK